MNFSFVHDFDIDEKTFWSIFFDEGYTRDLNRGLNMRSAQILEFKDEGPTIRRTQKMERKAAPKVAERRSKGWIKGRL